VRGKRKRRGGPSTLARLLKILLALAGKHFGMTLEEMGEEASVGRRTVYRHLKTLEECGVEIVRVWEPDNHGFHYLYRLKTIRGVRLDLTRRVSNG
jgi:predicted DNA-binding transcriptional regulator YafY